MKIERINDKFVISISKVRFPSSAINSLIKYVKEIEEADNKKRLKKEQRKKSL